MEQTDYSKMLPTEPPAGIVGWLYNNGYLNREYIVYKTDYERDPLTGKREKVIKCKCTSCDREFYQMRAEAECHCHNAYPPAPFGWWNDLMGVTVFDGMDTMCPICGNEVTTYYSGKMSRYPQKYEKAYPITVDNIDGHLVLFIWYIYKTLDRMGNAVIHKMPYEAYVAEKRKLVKLCGYYHNPYGRGQVFTGKWEQRKRFTDGCGEHYKDLIFPWDSNILNGTEAENSKLDIYLNCEDVIYPVGYLNLYLKHRNIENLITSNMAKFVDYKLRDTIQSYYSTSPVISRVKGIKWKEVKPHLMLGLTKEELRFIKKEHWANELIDYFITMKPYGMVIEDAPVLYKRVSKTLAEDLAKYEKNLMRAVRYVDKQQKADKVAKDLISVSCLKDYWEMASKRGVDLSNEDIRYPHRLRKAHDDEVRLIEVNENPKLNEPFKKRYKALKKFCFEFEDLCIHPAESEREMILEGKILNHCVSSYASQHANGKTSIFFIRHKEYPEEPYFTLEFNFKKMRVVQNRGFKNCDRTAEVKRFEKEWLSYVKEVVEKGKAA